MCEKFLFKGQRDTAAEFRWEFEVLAAPLKEIPYEVLKSTFVNRLKPKIRAEIRVLGPKGLDQIMEDLNSIVKEAWEFTAQRPIKSALNCWDAKKPETTFPVKMVTVGEKLTKNWIEFPTKRMTEAEW